LKDAGLEELILKKKKEEEEKLETVTKKNDKLK